MPNTSEHTKILRTISSVHKINNLYDLQSWIQNDLKKIIPHHKLICGTGYSNGLDLQINNQIVISDSSIEIKKNFSCNVLKQHIENCIKENKPQYINSAQSMLKFDLEKIDDHLIYLPKNIALHCMHMEYGDEIFFSYFCLTNLDDQVSKSNLYFLNLLIPNTHLALITLDTNKETPQNEALFKTQVDIAYDNLSPRELNVLNWIKEGKTNWEISQILNVSSETIKTHVKNICSKFDVENRSQAVAMGIKLNLIPERRQQ